MKILALRAAAFRRFGEGVAIEHFTPHVNVLAGPNELGKSTLFQALEAAFLLRHTTTGAALEGMRPRSGGEPLVESDFELDGRKWRIRKQFGRSRSAVLTDLGTMRTLARAGEAEDQLAAMIGARGDVPGRIGLMWVRQQRALQAPHPDVEPATGRAKVRGETNALIELLNQEIVEAAGSGLAEQVAKRAQADLDALVTSRGAKAGSAYAKALSARDQAREQLERIRAAVAASQERQARIVKGTGLLAQAEDPVLTARLLDRIATIEKAVSEAAAMRERNKAIVDQVKARDLEAKEARRALDDARAQSLRLTQVDAALTKGRSLHASMIALAEAIEANGATPARLSDLESALELCKRDELALQEMSTLVDVKPADGAVIPILADGVACPTTTRLVVAERLTLSIAGVGDIEISSSGTSRAAAVRGRRDEQHRRIADLLVAMDAANEDQARQRHQARETAVREHDEARQQFSMLVPLGLDELEAERAQIASRLSGLDLHELEQAAVETDTLALAARHTLEEAKAAEGASDRMERLAADLARAKHELQKRYEDARRFGDALARLKGEQAMADEQAGTGEERAEAAFETAQAHVRHFEDEIAALRLLCDTLNGTLNDVRTRYLAPVSRAFLPYLRRIFPDAAADFRDGFSLQALRRAGEEEEFATLSDGTREQLAVLVRMGFARLFADRGAPVPLVLDDPLVYSDDQRLAAMRATLSEAGQYHQIVVLTCREGAFAPMSANRLTLSPWQVADS